jgi:hypothetical protein
MEKRRKKGEAIRRIASHDIMIGHDYLVVDFSVLMS